MMWPCRPYRPRACRADRYGPTSVDRSGGIRIVDPVPQLSVRDPGPGGTVLISRQGPSELVERPQHEPLRDDATVQDVERGGLPPDLALQPARGLGQISGELVAQGVPLGGELDELGPQAAQLSINRNGHVLTSLRRE